ncbi:MAG: biopolymer transporter ExbD [Cyanobacteriota bacterium]|nr:biopolymer transporter ExbD [Cyanobacteriota bacterium]
MKINLESPTEEARIELIPLIDVIFCILTFFLLAALQLTRQQAISVDLPKASTGQAQGQEMLIVSIDPLGKTYIEQEEVTFSELQLLAGRYLQLYPNGVMVLYAPKEARYNDVVQVLDLLREMGGSRVALATLPGAPNSGNDDNSDRPSIGNTVNPESYPLPTPPQQ